MGDNYKRYLYKGAYEKPAGLIGEIEYLKVTQTAPTTTTDRFTFYDANTTTGNVVRIVDVVFTDATKATFSYAERVS